jgi:L-ascorbate metabolism protein UlaG (beta-lactamase superfamily)
VKVSLVRRFKMKRHPLLLILAVASLMACLFLSAGEVRAACRNPNIVEGEGPFLIPVAASGSIEVKWFGHSFFQMTSSSGTKIITDPFGAMGFPMPEVWPNVVTVGREHGNHNNVGLAKGKPLILRGLKPGTEEWDNINITFRDVLIYNVPNHQRGVPGYLSLRGSGFVFEMDGLCVFHTGDVSEPFNEDQLQMIGHVDILLLPIGGTFTLGPEDAIRVIAQLKPKIAVPMHYWYNTPALERFINGPVKARLLETNRFIVNKDTLPPDSEIWVMKVLAPDPI